MNIPNNTNRSENKHTLFYLSLMYLFWGMASSMIFTLLPLFIIEDLHGSVAQFGIIEGFVVFCSFLSKLCTGVLIDIFKRKINLLYSGTIATIASKILLACSINVVFVFIAKIIDRLAKGLRHAPVDAIFAELTSRKGYVYSMRHAINISGSLCGSLLSALLVLQFGHEFRLIFTLACIPTVLALYILVTKVKYYDKPFKRIIPAPKWKLRQLKVLPNEYWQALTLISLIMLTRFSEGFITLKAKTIMKDSIEYIPLCMSMYEVCIIFIAVPMGKLSDKINKYYVSLLGVLFLVIANIFGIFGNSIFEMILVYVCSGLHMGATHGLLTSFVAKTASKEFLGTAFALFYGLEGTILLITNCIAGHFSRFLHLFCNINDHTAPFIWGILTSSVALYYNFKLIKRNNTA